MLIRNLIPPIQPTNFQPIAILAMYECSSTNHRESGRTSSQCQACGPKWGPHPFPCPSPEPSAQARAKRTSRSGEHGNRIPRALFSLWSSSDSSRASAARLPARSRSQLLSLDLFLFYATTNYCLVHDVPESKSIVHDNYDTKDKGLKPVTL